MTNAIHGTLTVNDTLLGLLSITNAIHGTLTVNDTLLGLLSS